MINIILCGGNGTRLWPISRTLLPKQFVRLFDNKSLFQLTIQRNSLFCKKQLIVSNIEQYFLAVAQLEELGEENNSYLLEPIGRNTAPAIALACLSLLQDEIVFVTPSDHLIKNEVAYSKVINKAKKLAKEGFLVTFGIAPTFAETGFGYIESENEYDVKAFHEKPDELRAKKYLKAGNYFWNSGMFMFQAGVFLKELQKHSPQIFEASKYAFSNVQKGDETIKIKQEDMLNIPEDSIDYAVMEKSDRVKVIPSDIDWSDVGSFDSLYDELPKDENGNTLNEQFLGINSKNNLIYGQQRKIATVDIKDLIVVDTGDALLISKRGSSQKVKKVVQEIRKNSDLHNIHLTVHRPWGTYTILEDTTNYKIKKIVVKAKKRLSLQKHFHRNEHWIVVSGTAVVRVGDEEKILRANESTYIHAGVLHRLENQGNIDLVLIEVQVGEYLGEDDIVRIEDDYARNNI